jgi:hypothetical protein
MLHVACYLLPDQALPNSLINFLTYAPLTVFINFKLLICRLLLVERYMVSDI